MILSEKEPGKYKAFPTVAKVGNSVVVAFREGFVDIRKPHGRGGRVKILKSQDLVNWQEFETPFNDSELDAILSGPFGDNLSLATRSFEHRVRNDVYISVFKANGLPERRQKVQIKGVNLSAFFGHAFMLGGELLATAYGDIDGVQMPIILASPDFGKTWKIKSFIVSKEFRPILNETSIINVDDKFLAVMRSHEPSYDLYYSFGKNLTEWEEPRKIGLLGHAPVARRLSDGRIALVFRDLNGDLPGVGLAISDNGVDFKRVNICHYTGDLYNGGYGDFVEVSPKKLFVVYYRCDESDEPWIEAKVIDLQ